MAVAVGQAVTPAASTSAPAAWAGRGGGGVLALDGGGDAGRRHGQAGTAAALPVWRRRGAHRRPAVGQPGSEGAPAASLAPARGQPQEAGPRGPRRGERVAGLHGGGAAARADPL